ncbi:hypothetical protein GCM10011428_57580 [Streptomyces violaceus]
MILPSAYEDRALLMRPMAAAAVTTIRAGSAACRRSDTVPVPRMRVIACAVKARTTAAAVPVSNWQARSRTTLGLSTAHAIRAVCTSTEGSRRHIAPKPASASGFFPNLPSKLMVAGGGGGGVFALSVEVSVTVTCIPPQGRCRAWVARRCTA